MTHPSDLPAALPIAIVMALLVLILAPWLGGADAEACTETTAAASTSVVERSSDAACD